MKKVGMMLFVLTVLLSACGTNGEDNTVIVGGKNFTEQIILTHMMGDLLAERTDLDVVKEVGIGVTNVVHPAIVNDEIDIYAEYTGTAYMSMLNMEIDPQNPEDADTVYERVQEGYNEEFDISWLEPFHFENRYSLAMREEHAEELGIKTQSDLIPHSKDLVIGGNATFFEREDGLEPMNERYGYEWAGGEIMDEGLMYEALRNEEVDVISAFTTDGRIPAFNLYVLEDDRNFFPPYFAAPVIRNEVLEAHPEIADVLAELAPYLTEETMRDLNAKVDLDGEREDHVARNFLIESGLIEE